MVVSLAPSMLFSDDVKNADKFYKALNYKFALEIYEKVMKTNPSATVAEKIANCYRYINNTDSAEVWFKKVLTYPNVDAINHKLLADALKKNGKFDDAATSYLAWGAQSKGDLALSEELAKACIVAKDWVANPDKGAVIENFKLINSENADFCPLVYGNDIIFTSDRWQKDKTGEAVYGWTGNPYLKLYTLNKTTSTSTVLNGNINIGFHSGPAAINKTLDTIIFTRSVTSPDKKAYAGIAGKQYLLYAVLKNGKWKVKDKLPFNKDGKFSVQHPALSPDGRILYFSSDMPGGHGGMDLYYSEKLANGGWADPVNCGSAVNTASDDVFPAVRSDGKFYFSSSGHVNIGGLDIFSANGQRSSFTDVENLRSPINSPKDDFGILFNPDLKTGYLSSNRAGGLGLDDIYRFTQGVQVVPEEVFYEISGVAAEKSTGTSIVGLEVLLINKETGEEIKTTSDEGGKFSFTLAPNTDYIVRGNENQYFSGNSTEVSTKNMNKATTFNMVFELTRAVESYTITLNNIFYDFNKWNIRKDAVINLNKIADFMAELSNVNLQLTSHTDARGTAAYNQKLSEKRAKSAVQYLTGKGVDKARLTSIGMGEKELLNKCADGVKCSDKEHQINRRTEFKIAKGNL